MSTEILHPELIPKFWALKNTTGNPVTGMYHFLKLIKHFRAFGVYLMFDITGLVVFSIKLRKVRLILCIIYA